MLHLDTLSLTRTAERQSARMSKITNDGLTRSGTGCFIAVPVWQIDEVSQIANYQSLNYGMK